MVIWGNLFHQDICKIALDRLVAEMGALILFVGTFHWLFDVSLRRAMFKEIADTALENARIHDSGVIDCLLDSKTASEIAHWSVAQELIIGVHYSSAFIDEFLDLLKKRCEAGKITNYLVVHPISDAADYLRRSGSGHSDIQAEVNKIKALIAQCGADCHNVRPLFHKRVLRYSFICTEQIIWVKFFTNSKMRSKVPAIKVQVGSPLYAFFRADIKAMMEEIAHG